jgi:oligopeptide transport system substrate-binding protein
MHCRATSFVFLTFLVGALLLPFTGCSRLSAPKADFTFINGAEPESLDPGIVTGQPDGRLCLALFEGLTSRNADGSIQPGMAERWEISPDLKTYTFHIRDTQWSNGDPVTAQDFVRSWERVLNPALASKYADQLYYLENAEAYNTGKLTDFTQVGVKAIDGHTLIVRLKNPTPFFLDLCSFTTLLPVHTASIAQYGDDWIKPGKLISNGAYKLAEWRIDDHIRLVANPHYWRASSVHFKVIDALPTSNANTSFNLFYAGKADMIIDKGQIPQLILNEIRNEPYFHANPFLATYFYRFNVTRKPFNDVRVREALALALDKDRIVTRITKAGEKTAGSITPPGVPGYNPPTGLGHNLEQARKLLADAGFPDGRGFPKFSVLYNNSELNKQIAIEIQAMWHDGLGLNVDLRTQEWKVYLNTLDALDYDVARSSWVGDYNDPYTFLGCFMAGRGNNRTGYANPAYDKLLDQANAEPDPAKRMTLLQQAETILVEKDVPFVPIYYFVGIVLYDESKIGGFIPNVVDEHPLRELYRK